MKAMENQERRSAGEQQGGAMKKGWQTKKLADLVEVQNGYAFSSKDYSESGHFLMRIGNVQNGYISTADPKFIKLPADGSLKRFVLSEDDILVSLTGNVGRVGVIQAEHLPAALNQRVARISIRKDSPATRELLLLFLCSDWFREELIGAGHGAAQQNVSTKDLVEIKIPVPPLAEQQRIVGLLDEAFAGLATAKANAEKNLQNARALFESHLQSVLRNKKWKWKTLGDLCDDVEYGSSAKSKADGGVPVLRMGNIQDGRLDWENLVYTDDKAEIKKYLLKHNDVLFNRTNSPELVGKTAIYKSEMPAIFAGYLIRIHRKEELLDADYLTYFLNSQIAFDYGKTVVISSVNQANINGTKLKSYPIPAPSLTEQKAIVVKLNALSEETQRLARLYERKLAALEALKKSLLHQAFTGKL